MPDVVRQCRQNAPRLSNHAPRSRCSLWCPRAALPRERAEGPHGPSRSSAHGADCLREPTAPSLLASPGERRSPELAAPSAANVRVRRECLALSVRQDSIDCPAETDRLAGAYLNTAVSYDGVQIALRVIRFLHRSPLPLAGVSDASTAAKRGVQRAYAGEVAGPSGIPARSRSRQSSLI